MQSNDDKEYETHVRGNESLRDAMEGPIVENRNMKSTEDETCDKDHCCGKCNGEDHSRS